MVHPKAVLAFAVCLLVTLGFSQESTPIPQPYDVDEAYKVYSVLLPHEESYEFAKNTIVIREETVSGEELGRDCLSPDAAVKFKEAIEDYRLQNKNKWLLQRHFESNKPYEIVNSGTIKTVFDEGGWQKYYDRHPGSGGFIIMSVVGFNKDKTLAVLYSGSSCGSLCGSWSFHLLKKVDGKWTIVPGVQCFTVS